MLRRIKVNSNSDFFWMLKEGFKGITKFVLFLTVPAWILPAWIVYFIRGKTDEYMADVQMIMTGG